MAQGPSTVLASLGLLALAAGVPPAYAPAQERPAAAEGGARLVRSTSGTRGVQQGSRYVIEDPRTVFAPDKDRQVVVYFEWEARPGTHHCEARWKDPTGRAVLVSPIDYQAPARRFGIYWTMALPETATRGLWAVEAVVDGQPAGTHTFEIGTAAAAAATPARPILSSAEIYKRAVASMATIEALGTQQTFESALRCLRPGGTLSSLGVYSGKLQMPYEAFAAGLGDHRIVTTLCPGGKERMRRMMEVVKAGRVDFTPLLTHTVPLAKIEEGYKIFGERLDGVLKVAVKP